MKLLCTIGTQGLADGRRIKKGETYDVDDVTASALISAGYAKEVVAEPVLDTGVGDVQETVAVKVADSPDTTVEAHVVVEMVDDDVDVVKPIEATAPDPMSIAEDAIAMAESADDESAPPVVKKKRTYNRRK